MDINKIENIALQYEQESTIDSKDKFVIGWLAESEGKLVGGAAIFSFDDGFVIDYLSPTIKESTINIHKLVFDSLLKEAIKRKYLPLSIVRDVNDSILFIDVLRFSVGNMKDLPVIYRKRTQELCNTCVHYYKDCIPTVYTYSYNKGGDRWKQ